MMPLREITCRRTPEVMKLRLAATAVLSLTLSATSLAADDPKAAATAAFSPVGPVVCADKPPITAFTYAVPTARPPATYPEDDAASESEGWVRLGFTIGADGSTKDIVVLDRVGPSSMARAARLAVARWKYKPATDGGQAIEQFGNTAELLFRDEKIGNTAVHGPVVTKFDEARTLVSAAKYTEGITILEQTQELPSTLYEQAKVAFALAFAYEKSNDMPRALAHLRHALIEKGRFVEKAVVPAAQRLRMRLEVANGNLHYAACAPRLVGGDSFDPTGADLKQTTSVAAAAKARLSNPAPLAIEASLVADPGGAKGGVWEHILTRRKFKFSSPIGQVNEFRLTCVKQSTTSPLNETSQWEVPASAGPCVLRVYGEVGAAFTMTEEW
jgi:TonB family protein